MDPFSGHINHVREFDAEGDGAAIAAAQGWHDGAPMELWSRHHKLKRWAATRPLENDVHV